ncbi:MAG: sn-glycerol-1-phosphate dehydrogenase [Firmicutes bacterium]|jgi:glycerol-1-phosphate dehydrogenase [NAD(P)+]|nr:sn-glycerol-1-phosphate dehydrogenase [Bacillota bacterium]
MSVQPVPHVLVSPGAIGEIPRLVHEAGLQGDYLLVADENTYEAAGSAVHDILSAAGHSVVECILRRDGLLIPDERAVGEVTLALSENTRAMVAVGAGTINDLAKIVAYRAHIPYAAVATAPSMDGYPSPLAPITVRRFKRTYRAVPPAVIVADLNILARAPADMIRAGLGDVIGKYTALADWMLGHVITDERYSHEIAAEVRESTDRAAGLIGHDQDDADLVEAVTRALISTGTSMARWGNSRPASGSEHHIAHYWEMYAGLSGVKEHLHGIRVGVACVMVAGLFHRLFAMSETEVRTRLSHAVPETRSELEARVHEVFGPIAEEVLAWRDGQFRNEASRLERHERIIEHWQSLQQWVRSNVPRPEHIAGLLRRCGAPSAPEEIGFAHEGKEATMRNACEVRPIYTVLRLAQDLGVLR